MDKAKIIGRVLLQTDHSTADAILSQFRPMLRKTKFVEKIYNEVQNVFINETFENRRLIFIATIYQVYQPLSFLDEAAGKLPAGVRDEMARCLGFNNPEMCNHYKQFVEPPMKPYNTGPERPFKTKVMQIVERFKCFSINIEDSQFKLGL